jgi:hypothetical protein
MTKINLNKEIITKEALLKYVSDVEVYQKYIDDDFLNKKVILSPLRNEANPSFGFFIGESGELCFKDFVLGAGNCIKFVQMLFGLTYFEALSQIAWDFNLQDDFIVKDMQKTDLVPYTKTDEKQRIKFLTGLTSFKLMKKRRKWSLRDFEYWRQYGITTPTLKRYNVEPVSHIWLDSQIISLNHKAYCYVERKDNRETYKIYQPDNEKYKWIKNHDDSIWEGWEQLPEKGEILIITKSLKDVMAIVENTKFASVSLQCENILPKPQVFQELQDRFQTIYLLYDNDYDKDVNWGLQFSQKFSKIYDVIPILISENHKSKDFSDLIKNKGIEEACEILEQSLLPY